MIDLTTELTAWLRSTDARTLMKEIVAEAVQTEIRSALEDELIDVEGAAAILAMTEGALRKAVERGQVPCQRVGTRLRFRRSDLMRGSRGTTATASLQRRARPVAVKPAPVPSAASARTFAARSDRKIAS